MDIASPESIATPSARQLSATAMSPPKRSRAQRLTFVNRSTRLGKRIDELKALFESAIPAGELTPLKREQLSEAAQKKALAEAERGARMRGEARSDLDELVRLERAAVAAVKALGIVEERPRQVTLAHYLAAKAGNDGEEI
jgi:hypothetical protein